MSTELTTTKTNELYQTIVGKQNELIRKNNAENRMNRLEQHKDVIREKIGLEDDFTEENIKARMDSQNMDIFHEIANSDDLSYLGIYKLPDISNNTKKYCNSDFWMWAKNVVSVSKYSLQEDLLDETLVKYIDSDTKNAMEKSRFDDIVKVAEYNGSPKSVKVFSKLMQQMVHQIDEVNSKMPGLFESKNDFNKMIAKDREDIINNTSYVVEALGNIIKNSCGEKSYNFYLNMKLDDVTDIFECADKIEKSGNGKVKYKEELLNMLVPYYVVCAKQFAGTEDLVTFINNWKLGELFKIAYANSNDEDFQKKILDSFAVDNSYLPFLPIRIIEDSLQSKDNSRIRIVVDFLKERYKITTDKEKEKIRELNEKVILDEQTPIEMKERAYSWHIDTLNDDEKNEWCIKVFNKICRQDLSEEDQNKLEFKKILEECFDNIADKEFIYDDICHYITNGKNNKLARKYFYYLRDDNKNYFDQKEKIKDLNEKIILSDQISIEIKELAYSWHIDTLNDDEKNEWCIKVFNKICHQDLSNESQNKFEFKKILDDCFDNIADKEFIYDDICYYVTNGKNKKLARKYFYYLCDDIESYFDQNGKYDKEIDRAIEFFAENYESGNDNFDSTAIEGFFAKIIKNGDSALSRSRIYEKIEQRIYDKDSEEKRKILLKRMVTDLFDTNDNDFKRFLIEKYFNSHMEASGIISEHEIIDFLWENKDFAKKSSFLEKICASGNKALIEYAMLKGWGFR